MCEFANELNKFDAIRYLPGVDGGYPFLDLNGVRVSLLDEAVGQLREQAHALAALPRDARRGRRRRRPAALLRLPDPIHGRAGRAFEKSELLALL